MEKYLIYFIFLFVQVSLSLEPLSCEKTILKGEKDAEKNYHSENWFWAGFTTGILLGPVGLGVVGSAFVSNPSVKFPPNNLSLNRNCYRDGYSNKARGKNIKSSLKGGLLGTGIFVVLLSSVLIL